MVSKLNSSAHFIDVVKLIAFSILVYTSFWCTEKSDVLKIIIVTVVIIDIVVFVIIIILDYKIDNYQK